MRIIAGEFRGRKIKQPELATVRPTKDRIREAVFNIIAGEVPEAHVLDLFAGSGAYGLEALSRGAKKAVFIDNDKGCGEIITENVKILGVSGQSNVIMGDVFRYIESLNKNRDKFNIIFLDPPYNKGMVRKTLLMVYDYDILNSTGMLIIEHHKAEAVPEGEGDVSIYKQKTYGDTSISIFLRK